jgi:hypothetical protein
MPGNKSEEEFKLSWSRHKETGSFVALLSLLEHPLSDVKSVISALDIESFPYEGLISFALSGRASDYWAALAVNWLEQGVGVNEKISSEVYGMVERKWASQRIRHRAYRLVKSWERNKPLDPNDA